MLKKFFSITLVSIFILVAALSFSSIGESSNNTASIFDGITNFFRNISNQTTTIEDSQEDVSLYKPVIDYEEAVTSAVEQARQSVVSIAISKNLQTIERCRYESLGPFEIYQPCPGEEQNVEVGGGSGFIVSEDGLVVTNKHVVRDEEAQYTVLTNDGNKYDAEIIATDPIEDVAVLQIDADNLTPAVIGDSSSLKLGQTAIAIGNSLGEFRNTVSVGVVSGLSRNITASGIGFIERIENVIQTDAAINQGNSGGPLLNLKGEVIGMNTAIAQGAQNIGFAIPINRIKRDIISVQETGEIKTPFLGVRYMPITPSIAQEQDLPVEYGALIRGTDMGPAVTPDSAADEAGIQSEDIILELNGTRVDTDNSLGFLISRNEIGETVTLTILRDGEEIEIQATLKERPDTEE